MRRATQHGKWLQAAVIILIGGGLGFRLVAEINQSLGVTDLMIDVAELRSDAAESRLIAEQALSGRLTATYFQTQLSMLRDGAESITRSLSSAEPQAGLEGSLFQARGVAGRLTASR